MRETEIYGEPEEHLRIYSFRTFWWMEHTDLCFVLFLFCYFAFLVGNPLILICIQCFPPFHQPMCYFLCHLSSVDICYTSCVTLILIWWPMVTACCTSVPHIFFFFWKHPSLHPQSHGTRLLVPSEDLFTIYLIIMSKLGILHHSTHWSISFYRSPLFPPLFPPHLLPFPTPLISL